MPIVWNAESIWETVSALLPQFSIEILPQVDSTNSELMRRARAGQVEPVLLVAEHQSAGRGRMGRTWVSSPDAAAHQGAAGSLTFSLGIALAPQDWSGLSLAVGLSLAQSLHPDVHIKWPNDLWWKDHKVGGILTETASIGEQRYAVIGVGLNIQKPAGDGWRTPPAGLQDFLPGVQTPDVLAQVIPPLVKCLLQFENQGFAPLHSAYASRDVLLDQVVEVSDGSQGIARGVDAKGALLVHTEAGLKKITSAEVSVRPRSWV
jgi:BirA family transcriptional regulator, biotin operon repressor / biotin---[acetyl-CoA-carboxylase] ligase